MACEVTGDGVRAKCMVTPRDRVASLDRNAVALFAAGATVHTSRLLAGMARESMARDSVATLVIIPRRGSSHPHSCNRQGVTQAQQTATTALHSLLVAGRPGARAAAAGRHRLGATRSGGEPVVQ